MKLNLVMSNVPRILGFLVLLFFSFFTSSAQDTVASIEDLKKLSIEELMDIEVTSVSKVSQKLTEVASAIQVLTREDILRSGATNIPEALKLAPNLQVAQINSSAYVISARGFNTVFANKLLVLIDGRTIYTPLFGGVLWDMQHILLEDVDRIEIISGPGAALWGANAVNGVINIISRKAAETEGLYVSLAGGDFFKKHAALRYGSTIGNVNYRVYGQHYDRNSTMLPTDVDNTDSWRTSQGGFRADWQVPSGKDIITLQGDVYSGIKRTTPELSDFDGQNLVARWSHTSSAISDITIEAYYDRYWRNDPSTADELYTYDIDFQHHFLLSDKHNFLYGGGYRYVYDKVINRIPTVGLDPEEDELPIYNVFVQDEWSVFKDLKLTLGVKLLHNTYSDFEMQPSARFAWNAHPNLVIWGAVSRAIRAPSRFDVDYKLPIEPQPPTVPSVAGGPNFDSEKLHAFELGYRFQPNSKSSFSLSTFYNQYHDVYSVEALPETMTYQIQNGTHAESWGAELSGFYQLTPSWRLKGGFTFFDKNISALPGRSHDPSYLANDAMHHAVLQSFLNLPLGFKLDITTRYLDYIPASFATARIPEYFTFDTRIGWEYKKIELSIVGQNLLRNDHTEFGSNKIPTSIYGRITCRL